MESLNLILYISFACPLAMLFFICRGRARVLTGFLVCGLTACLISGYVAGHIYSYFGIPKDYFQANFSPAIEECMKALPVLVFAFLKKQDDRTLLEGAAAAGVGFAVLENAYLLSVNLDIVSIPLALARGFGSGMMHGICTLTVGYGMTFVHTRKKLFYTGTAGLLSLAVMYHSLYNILVQSQFQMAGFVLPMLTFIPLVIVLRRILRNSGSANQG